MFPTLFCHFKNLSVRSLWNLINKDHFIIITLSFSPDNWIEQWEAEDERWKKEGRKAEEDKKKVQSWKKKLRINLGLAVS